VPCGVSSIIIGGNRYFYFFHNTWSGFLFNWNNNYPAALPKSHKYKKSPKNPREGATSKMV
jgi:hypothetical protein